MHTDTHFIWYLAGAVEWLEDNIVFNTYYGYQGAAEGEGYIYTDGTSHGHFEGCGNGWGYYYSNEGGGATGSGERYAY